MFYWWKNSVFRLQTSVIVSKNYSKDQRDMLTSESITQCNMFTHHKCQYRIQPSLCWYFFIVIGSLEKASKNPSLTLPDNVLSLPHKRAISAQISFALTTMMMIVWQYETFNAMMSQHLIQKHLQNMRKKSFARVLCVYFIPPHCWDSRGDDSQNTSLSIDRKVS